MGKLHHMLSRATWREWGFNLSDEEVVEVDRVFTSWFEVYNRASTGAYASQEALFGIHEGFVLIVGEDDVGDRIRRNGVSWLRAGYCIAVVEESLEMRKLPDPYLRELFLAMDAAEGWPPIETGLARALVVGRTLGRVAAEMTLERPEIGAELDGFVLREAVFADLRHTLGVKLRLMTMPRRTDVSAGDILMRFGHAVGVCEQALAHTMPVGAFSSPS